MPAEIVTQTRPAPECNLLPGDAEHFVEELAVYYRLFASAFRRPEQFTWGKVYLRGLLGDLPRKTTERIALDLGYNVRDLQYFVGQSPWPLAPVTARHQQLVAETLGEPDGVALIDESGVVKQGDNSVGVGPQYCGAVGKVANSQNGGYLGYVSRKGCSIVAGRLFMPEAWFDDAHAEKRQAYGVPADLTFQTKPQIALDLLQEAVVRDSLSFQWGAAQP
jgi:SRSO17 transposase